MAAGVDPLHDPTNPVIEPSSASVTPIKLGATDINSVVTQIQAALPTIRFAYVAWKTYMTVEQKVTMTVYVDADKVIAPLLAKDPATLTIDDTAAFVGAFVAVLQAAGQQILSELSPLMGTEFSAVLTALGLLGGA
jgi:hypothetical protein